MTNLKEQFRNLQTQYSFQEKALNQKVKARAQDDSMKIELKEASEKLN